MKHLLLFAIVLAPSFASAHDEELPINSGAELRDWCQHESDAYFVGRGELPFNWTATHVERGNTLVVEGKWRVDGEMINVECRAARGAQRRYAVMEVKTDSALKWDIGSASDAYMARYMSSTETTLPVLVGPDLSSIGFVDSFVSQVGEPSDIPRSSHVLIIRLAR